MVPFIPPTIPEGLESLPTVPADNPSVIGIDATLPDGEEDNVGKCCEFFPFRNTLKAPSHLFRGGVPDGDDVAITTESELIPLAKDKHELDPSTTWASCDEVNVGVP